MLPALLMAILAATPPVPADAFLRQFAETGQFTNGRPTSVWPTPDGRWVLFLRSEANSDVQSLYSFDVSTGRTDKVLTADALLRGAEQKLSVEERAQLERMRISARGFTGFDLSYDGKTLVTVLSGRIYLLDLQALASGQPLATSVRQLPVEGVLSPELSPNGQKLAYVKDWDLYVLDVASGRSQRLTTGGTERFSHGLPEFVAQEEMYRFAGFWWAPDSQHIAYEESDTRDVETFTLQDSAHPERPASTFPYPRPGKANAKVRLGLVSTNGGPTTWVRWDSDRFPYMTRVVWPPKAPLTVLVENRAQTEEVLISVQVQSGATHALLTESDPAFLQLAFGVPAWLEDGSGFFWLTERTGDWSAEFHAADGTLNATWVRAEDKLVGLLGYDVVERALYFYAAPESPDLVVMRVRAGGRPERVFPSSAERVTEYLRLSRDKSIRVHTTLAPDGTMRDEVTDRAGNALGLLPSVAVAPPFVPKVEFRKVGARGFWTSVVRPRAAIPGQKLPVLVDSYGGPHVNVVHSVPADYLLEQWQADQGFLVVAFDGRGTSGRGRAWERAVKDDFAGVILDDQVEALQALAAVVPEMDLSRVGIFGWSFGGYLSALAVLRRPDVFHAAVAGAPVADWLDYDTFFSERYLGIPPQANVVYARNSLLEMAPLLQRPLLLLHGTSDDNVYFFNSLKLTNALFRAGKQQFEFVPLVGFTHMVAEPAVLERLQRLHIDFFKAHLGQTAPRVAAPGAPALQ